MDVLVGVVSVAMGWGFAWLASKGISFIWPAAEPWVFYWFGGMWSLVAFSRMAREGHKRFSWIAGVVTGILLFLFALAAHGEPLNPEDDRMWIALKRVQCGSERAVIWREVKDVTDYYTTREVKVGGTFPRVWGDRFVYDDASGRSWLDGKPCRDVK
jgi:hypothetical protein